MKSVNGKVILLGAGPGDPGLLTVKGKTYLEQADCIIYDRLASPELLSYAGKNCEIIYVGKENHHHTMKQEDINALLAQKSHEYALTVRLKGGDPYVFGRGGEEALYLTERNIEVEVIPGISSAIAAPATAGIPVTHRGLAQGFQVITAHSRKDAPAEIDYSQLLDPEVTDIFLMGLAHVGEIAEGLTAAGRSAGTPAAVISHGTTAQQKVCTGTLADIGEKTKTAGLTSPALIVVGDVVNLSEKLNFYEKLPLVGKTYIVPYIGRMENNRCMENGHNPESGFHMDQRPELAHLLGEAGAVTIPLKIGQIICREIPEKEMRDALKSDWLVFTSANGVNAFLWNLKKLHLDARAIGMAKIAAIGTSTAAELEKAFLQADLIPKEQNGSALCQALKEACSPDSKITLFAAAKSNPELNTSLGAVFAFSKVIAYENENCAVPQLLRADAGERESALDAVKMVQADGIFFTSASAVKRTIALLGKELPGQVYSIGPKCSEELRRQGIETYIQAEESSYQGLYAAVLKNH